MQWLGELWRRLLFQIRRRQFDSDLEEEMRFHLDMQARGGGGAAARRQFGNELLLRESARDAWSWRWVDALARDIRYALRAFGRSPATTSGGGASARTPR